ncbi:MAG: ABC transporter permease [Acidobacteria bacterium]|nr:ABC transporter permease [Acidobacteriota bacterium]
MSDPEEATTGAEKAPAEPDDSSPPTEEASGGEEASRSSWYEAFDSWSSSLFSIRRPVPGWQRWLLGSLPIFVILLLWWLVTGSGPAEERVISPTILPSPLEVARSFRALWFERALTRNVLISLGRVVAGFAVGVAIAFPLGLAMGSFSKVRATFNPLSVLGAYLPIPALVPLTMSLFGTGEEQKIAFLGIAFLIYLLPLIVAAVDQVDETYLKTAYTLGASRTQAVLKVLLPIAWPEIFQSLRLGFGIGWSYILLAEMVDIGKGLGGIIITSQRRGPREHIYLVLLVIVALAFVTDKIWATLGRFLFPYREERR